MRLIDADRANDWACANLSVAEYDGFHRAMKAQPTIAERTAQELNPFDDELPYCSECKKEITGDGYNYCPNCGARFTEADHE